MRTYQVEYFDRETETDRLVPYDTRRAAAHKFAKQMSERHDGSAYVVSMIDDEAVGNVSYVFGLQSDKEGDTK